MIDIILPAFALSVVLLGIHAYYGIRIIERGIIFTDLAIGQWAALGAAVALLLQKGGRELYGISLVFALVGGSMIALASKKLKHPEAFIGLLYAMGLSGSVLVLSHSVHGTEVFQKLMAADILFTPYDGIFRTGILYTCVGIILVASTTLHSQFWKDLIFFSTFAVTVTSSVKMAGVLTVFAILVGPAYVANFVTDSSRLRLYFAWAYGIVVNILAVIVSYVLDLPTGYTIVFAHAALALLISILMPEPDASSAKFV